MRFTLHRDKVERKIQTGHTSYECRRSCYLHCGANLRKASPPSGVGVVKGTTTGSSISLSWNQPSDTGGRYAYSTASKMESQAQDSFGFCTSSVLLCMSVEPVHTCVAPLAVQPNLVLLYLVPAKKGTRRGRPHIRPRNNLDFKKSTVSI